MKKKKQNSDSIKPVNKIKVQKKLIDNIKKGKKVKWDYWAGNEVNLTTTWLVYTGGLLRNQMVVVDRGSGDNERINKQIYLQEMHCKLIGRLPGRSGDLTYVTEIL